MKNRYYKDMTYLPIEVALIPGFRHSQNHIDDR